ncbi:hypothetical protein IKO50_07310 [bacterium]|nr:hypothetical protein [bacterium]
MALKGQKHRKYTDNERDALLNEYFDGASSGYLARKYNIPIKTVKNWIYKYKNPDKFPGLGRKPSGRPKEKDLTKEDYKERYEILKKYQAFLKAQREKK